MSRPGPARDRIQVGAFFGALAGLGAFLLVLLWAAGSAWLGGGPSPARVVPLNLALLLVYILAGGAIGGAWPLRQTRGGRVLLWLIAATPVSITLISLEYGPPTGWPARAWLWLPVMIPAFAWVLGSGSGRRP